jgi:hypothetical protein
MMHERIVCSACSKHSGLNDLIYSALNVSFMVAFYMSDISLNRPTELVPLTKSPALVMAQSTLSDGGFSCYSSHKLFA